MRLLIADDHEMVRDTMGAFLSRETDLDCEGVGTLGDALTRIRRSGRFDLVLLDYGMPGMNGLEGLEKAIAANGERSVAIMSGVAPRQVAREALAAGAAGFLPKSMAARSLVSAVRFMLAGEQYAPVELLAPAADELMTSGHPLAGQLTLRETQVLGGLCRGLSNKEIALELDLREVTIKLHVKTLCRKLGARNRTHAVTIANGSGLDAAVA